MRIPDDVAAAADYATRLHDLTEQYLYALSRYDAVPKTEEAFGAAVEEEAARRERNPAVDWDGDRAAIRQELAYDRECAREQVVTLADELQRTSAEALAAAGAVYDSGRMDSAAEEQRRTGFEAYDPAAAVSQIRDDLETLAEADAETVPQMGVHTGANTLVDGPPVPNPATPAGEAAAADRTYLDMTADEQEAELLRQLEQDEGDRLPARP